MRPASTAKHFKESIVGQFIKKKLNRCFHVKNTSGCTIDKEASGGEGITPEPKRNRCMSQKSKSSFNKMPMLTLGGTILLMCVRTS
jgi:hypothetical protein